MEKILVEGTDLQNVPLVQVRDGKAVTTSLQLALFLERKHFELVKDIRSLNYSKDFLDSNFIPGIFYTESYSSETNKFPMFYITNDGFLLITSSLEVKMESSLYNEYTDAFYETGLQLRPKPEQKPNEIEPMQVVDTDAYNILVCLNKAKLLYVSVRENYNHLGCNIPSEDAFDFGMYLCKCISLASTLVSAKLENHFKNGGVQ